MSICGSGSTRRWSSHEVRWHWVKGHAGHDLNERADQLAREASRDRAALRALTRSRMK